MFKLAFGFCVLHMHAFVCVGCLFLGIVLSQLRNIYEAYFKEPLEFNYLGYTKLGKFIREELGDTCVMLPTGPFNSLVLSADATKNRYEM